MQKVLIVDDIAENLYFLEFLLKGNGFNVHTARNGAEALESARNILPDLIVSDILMPVMDGYVLCRECKKDERLKRIPFMFYTGTFVDKKDEILALNLGADCFVIKPQEPETLMGIIRGVLTNFSRGEIQSSRKTPLDETSMLREYSEALFNKLEKKIADLEGVNQELQGEISERERAERERVEIQTLMIQQDKLASIGQLATGVAHEINSPVGFIRSNLETLVKHTEKMKRYIETVDDIVAREGSSALQGRMAEERSNLNLDKVVRDISTLISDCSEGTERIIRTVQDLKEFSHHDTLVEQNVNINLCCDTAIRIVHNEIKYVATLNKEYGVIPPVVCNSQQIGQVIMNLLSNAVHAIQAKGVDAFGEIIVRTWCDEHNVYISVADTGCGIQMENYDQIFKPFFTTKSIGKGTGLGLSISSEIIHKHGGEISVASELGKGTTFTISLSLHLAHRADEDR